MKVTPLIAAILLGAVAGCRSVAPVRAVDDRCVDSSAAVPPKTANDGSPLGAQPVSYVEQAQEPHLPDTSENTERGSPWCPSLRGPLTLSDLEEVAFQNNPTLAVAAARMDAACGREVQAGLYPNPVIGYHGTELGNLGTAGQQGAFISQRFVTAGKLRLDQAMAGMETDEALFQWHAQQQRVLSDLRVRFYEALVAQRRVELTRNLAEIGDDLVRATRKLIETQLGTENDLLQAEIRADEAHILYDNACNQHNEAWRRLTAVIGVPTMPMVPLAGDLEAGAPGLSWHDCYSAVLDRNPEMNAAQARLDRAAIAIRRARREPIPDVDVSVSVRHHNVSSDDVANVQVGIPIPIFDRNQGNVCSAEAEWVAASNEVMRIQLDLQDRLAVVFRRYADARQQVDRYAERMLPRAERSLKLVMDGYEQGQVPYLTLIESQQTHLQVNLSYLESLRTLRTASAIIEGQLLTGGLSESQ
jgi:cobalt-zinc-cadmium efflux system outer membrane protein